MMFSPTTGLISSSLSMSAIVLGNKRVAVEKTSVVLVGCWLVVGAVETGDLSVALQYHSIERVLA